MTKVKIAVSFGTRPEAIKLAPLILSLSNDKRFSLIVINSGQHKSMLDDVLSFFNISPDFNLNIMGKNQTLSSLTSKLSIKFDDILKKEKPDIVVVQGDTTTAFVCALTSFYNKIKIAHVEAGLRTGSFLDPFPEEMNRKFISELSTFHFPPTSISEENLLKEGIDKTNILRTGNTIVDSLNIVNRKLIALDNNAFLKKVNFNYNKKNIFISCHRRESFGVGLINICKAILDLSTNNDYHFYFPVHLNPNVKKVVNKFLNNSENVTLLEPLNYSNLVTLIKSVNLILTDSGGIQEEAPSFNKFVLILRNSTERPEGVKAGLAKIVGTDTKKIIKEVNIFFKSGFNNSKKNKCQNPYGDGSASQRIIDFLWEKK